MELQNKYVKQAWGVACALPVALILGAIVKVVLEKLLVMYPFSVSFNDQACSTAAALLVTIVTFLEGIRRPANERPYRFEAPIATLWGMMCILGVAKLLIYYLSAVLFGTTAGLASTLPVIVIGVVIWVPFYFFTYEEVWREYYTAQAQTKKSPA